MNGNLETKNESAQFIPRNGETRLKDQILFEGLDQDQNKGKGKSYHERYKEKVKVARMLGCVAAACFILLLATITVIVYLTVQLSFANTKLPEQTTVTVVTSGHDATSSYENTTTLKKEVVTIFGKSTTPQTAQQTSTTSGYDTTFSFKNKTTLKNETAITPGMSTTPQTIQSTSTASKPDPIVFVRGKFTFSQASEACSDIGKKLALKEDMQKAFQIGYERCRYGWLGDSHAGYVMQESGARPACGEGVIGLIYTPYKDPQAIVGGAYCAPKSEILQIKSEPSVHNKSVNWWVTLDPADVYDLKYLLQMSWKNVSSPAEAQKRQEDRTRLLKSFRVVYPCCNFLNIAKSNHGNSTVVDMRIPASRMKILVELYKDEFKSSNLSIYPHLKASHEAFILHGAATVNRSQTIDDIVFKAILSGVDGLVMEYEPHTDYTRAHAEIYRYAYITLGDIFGPVFFLRAFLLFTLSDFLDELNSKLSQHGIKLGMVVASWGILKYYDVYSKSTVDIIGSMSSTYYGHNIISNMNHVDEMMKWIDLDRLQVGIGAMHMSSRVKQTSSFGWNQNQLKLFIDWLKRKGANHLHIWPEKWGRARWVERYFINAFVSFTK